MARPKVRHVRSVRRDREHAATLTDRRVKESWSPGESGRPRGRRLPRGMAAVAVGRTVQELAHAVERAAALSACVEIRLDWLGTRARVHEVCGWLREWWETGEGKESAVTLIGTCRRVGAGGKFRGSVGAQVTLLKEAAAAGCDWLDVEVETWRELGEAERAELRRSAKLMVSYHDFGGAGEQRSNEGGVARKRGSERGTRRGSARKGWDEREVGEATGGASSQIKGKEAWGSTRLSSVVRRLKGVGADAYKVAIATDSLRDALRVIKLAHSEKQMVAVPMGEMVAAARILALREGSALAYAPVEQRTAPGQVSFDDMKNLYRADQLDRRTRIYGVIGYPIAHSLSPAMHNAAFQARSMNSVYLPFPVRDLRDFLAAARELGVAGFSVTIPHKREIMKYLDGCDALAQEIGAVNTVAVGTGKLKGYNTDYLGVLRALESRMKLRGKRVLILGAGGAARAAAFAVGDAGAEVLICARKRARAAQLARDVSGSVIGRGQIAAERFDVIVNATPVGMHRHSDASLLQPREMNCSLAFDLVYRPLQTRFLRIAEQLGIATFSGIEMFIAQGAAQWEIWTGERAPVAFMRRAAMNILKKESADHGSERQS